jgi:hypothetical protein
VRRRLARLPRGQRAGRPERHLRPGADCRRPTAAWASVPCSSPPGARRQGTTCNANDLIGTNDVHGCGNFGLAEDRNCAPLDRHLSHTECDQAPPWACGNNNTGTTEGLLVTKPGSNAGGVLCCH